ncbi:MAG: LemA family protein [Ilumatobacter sp.]|jgi:LemA protein
MNTLIIIAVVAVLVIFGVVTYNALVRLRNQVDNAWAQIDVQLTRRADLIPNLVNTVKGYAEHERETLDAVISARSVASGASTPAAAAAAEGPLTAALGRLFAVAEAYPDLKADANFRQLQEELTSTENRIGYARQHYNDSTTAYNTRIQSFPTLIVARAGSFTERELFDAPVSAESVPNVEF